MGIFLRFIRLTTCLLCGFELFLYKDIRLLLWLLFCLGIPPPRLIILRFLLRDQAIIYHWTLIVLRGLSQNSLALLVLYGATCLYIGMEVLLLFLLLDSLLQFLNIQSLLVIEVGHLKCFISLFLLSIDFLDITVTLRKHNALTFIIIFIINL